MITFVTHMKTVKPKLKVALLSRIKYTKWYIIKNGNFELMRTTYRRAYRYLLIKHKRKTEYSKTPIYRGVWGQGNIRGKSGSAVNRGFVLFTLCMFSPIWGKWNSRGISGFAVNRGAVNRGFTVQTKEKENDHRPTCWTQGVISTNYNIIVLESKLKLYLKIMTE